MKDDIKRRSYIWNTVSGMINAGQSAVILILISYIYSIAEAGVFFIGYAIALLGMTLAKYGQRNFQVTDVAGDYSFAEYRNSRWITVTVTMLLMTGYLLLQWELGNYDMEKLMIVWLLCLWKQIDAIEDVYYGMYQQKGRLDIGTKRYSERLIFSTLLFCLLILLRIRFLAVVLIAVILSCVMAVFLIRRDKTELLCNEDYRYCSAHVRRLLVVCLTLCVSSTLSIYIGNLPKYFIDALLEDAIQAEFGYLIMPAFVIMVLSTVAFQPIIRDMGEAVKERSYRSLTGYVVRQLVYIAVITGVVLLCGGILGIPVLNLLYHVDLSAYWWAFMVLLTGGGFYAVSQFLFVPIVSMRWRNVIAIIYVIVTGISILAGWYYVSRYELWGASLLYLMINAILSFILIADYLVRIRRMRRENSEFEQNSEECK